MSPSKVQYAVHPAVLAVSLSPLWVGKGHSTSTELSCAKGTALHSIALRCNALHSTSMLYTLSHCTALQYTALHCTAGFTVLSRLPTTAFTVHQPRPPPCSQGLGQYLENFTSIPPGGLSFQAEFVEKFKRMDDHIFCCCSGHIKSR